MNETQDHLSFSTKPNEVVEDWNGHLAMGVDMERKTLASV